LFFFAYFISGLLSLMAVDLTKIFAFLILFDECPLNILIPDLEQLTVFLFLF